MGARRVGETELRRWLSDWPGVGTDVKWRTNLCFLVGGKMFCIYGLDERRLSFKVGQERFLELTDRPGFRPAPYLARAHWVTLDDPTVIPAKELQALLRDAYALILARLPKRTRQALV